MLFLCLASVGIFAAPPEDGSEVRYYPRVRTDRMVNYAPGRQNRVGEINLAPLGLLILVNFTDTVFKEHNSPEAFDSLANSSNYTYNGAYGSAREYFRFQSDGKYVPVFDVVGPVTLPKNMAYYGANGDDGYDAYTADFLMDAVDGACKIGADLSKYDNDNDSVVDFVYILYAGYGEQDTKIADAIWAHNWDLVSSLSYGFTHQKKYYYNSETDYNLPKYQGYYINNYACSNELRKSGDRSGIGVFCHEFGHVLGIPDYYPTGNTPVVAVNQTPGAWSIMAYACYTANGNVPCNYSVYDKYYLGWTEPQLMSHGVHTLPADNSVSLVLTRDLKMPVNGPMTEDTVYYFENRQYQGWDLYLPGHGMVVWQVVYNKDEWCNNIPNDNTVRYNLLSADGSSPYTKSIWGHDKEGCPFPGTSNIQQLRLFGYQVNNITEDADGNISFTFIDPSVPTGYEQSQQNVILPQKTIINGRMLIKRGDNTYTVLGQSL